MKIIIVTFATIKMAIIITNIFIKFMKKTIIIVIIIIIINIIIIIFIIIIIIRFFNLINAIFYFSNLLINLKVIYFYWNFNLIT